MMALTFAHKDTGDIAVVKVQGKDVVFGIVSGGQTQYSYIEGAKISIVGILKDHPDLKGRPVEEIRKEGVKRFKKHLFSFSSWEAKKNYVKEELEKNGYRLCMQQLPGQRARSVK